MKKHLPLLPLLCASSALAAPVDDLAQNRTVTASVHAEAAAYCVDGIRDNNAWTASANDAPWIQVDLGKVQRVGCVVLIWGETFASNYSISLSKDGSDFQTIATESAGDGAVDAHGFDTTEAQFVRVSIQAAATDTVALRSLEVYAGAAHNTVVAPAANAKPSPKGRLVREWTFDAATDWREAQNRDLYPVGFLNNYTWGRKDIEVRPCQGASGTGILINIRGISQGEMQFWTAPWPLWRHKFYRVTFKAKGEGFDGKFDVMVRRAVHAWTRLVTPRYGLTLTDEWQEFSFSGPGATDVDNDFGVMFSTSQLGRILIDDIRVEEFDENPEEIVETKNTNPIVQGNLIPNSSFEIERNKFWSAVIPQNDPYLHLSDPGFVRREGGKFGRHCFALEGIHTPEKRGAMTAVSLDIPVATGAQYTFSFWMHGKGQAHAWVGAGPGASKLVGSPKEGWGEEWVRHSITTKPIPEDVNSVRISFQKGGTGELYFDGFQLEVGDTATDYKPAHPYEIEATVEGGLPNIIEWGKPLPLLLSAYPALPDTPIAEIPATLKLVTYPDKTVLEKKVTLIPGKTLPLELNPVENGLFRIELTAEDPTLAPAFENIAARLPAPRTDVGAESFFGGHISVRPYFLNYAHQIGLKWIRLHDCSNITKMKWGNPEPDVYQWHDESIDAIRAAGFHIVGLPDYFSPFAKRNLGDKANTTFQKDDTATGENPIDVDAFANWCRRVAEHYRGRIDTWELVNEPYINGFYPGNAAQFAELFAAGKKAIREANPQAKILGWCTELTTRGFIDQIPKDGIRDIDVFSFHAYFPNTLGGGTMSLKDDLREVKAKFLTEQDPGQYWNTEGSWGGYGSLFYTFSKHNNAKAHIAAAANDSRIWIEQKKAGVSKFFFYTLHQSDSMQYRGSYKNLTEYDRTVSVGGAVTAVAAWFIDGLDPIPLTQREGAVEGLFSGKGRTTYTVYADSLYAVALAFDLSKLPAEYLVTDVMGTDLRKTATDSTRIPLSTTPIYVHAQTADHAAVLAACQAAITE